MYKKDPVRFLIIFTGILFLMDVMGWGQYYWEKIEGPPGAYVSKSILLPNGYILIGTNGAGVYRSTDNGYSWDPRLYNTNARCFTLSSNGVVYLGTLGKGVYYSDDNGLYWYAISQETPVTDVQALFWHPDNILFAGTTDAGIFWTSDNGSHWYGGNENNPGLVNGNVRDFLMIGDTILAATRAGVHRSEDNGASWTLYTDGMNSYNVGQLFLHNDGTVLAGMWGYGGIYRSLDNGRTWEFTNTGIGENSAHIFYSNSSGTIFAGTNSGIWKSNNSGLDWEQSGLENLHVYALTQNQNSDLLAGTREEGMFISTDQGMNWNPENFGLNSQYLLDVIVEPSGKIFVSSFNKIYFENNGWEDRSAGLDNKLVSAMMLLPNGDLIAGTEEGIYKSLNNGISWNITSLDTSYFESFLLTSSGRLYAGSYPHGLYYTDNGGDNWIQVTSLPNGDIPALAENQSGHIFAGTWFDGIYRSEDNGTSWTQINNGLEQLGIRSLAVDDIHGKIYAGAAPWLFVSEDNGDNWQRIVIDQIDQTIPSLLVNSKGNIYAGSEGFDVFSTNNDGEFWHNFYEGITSIYIEKMYLDHNSHILAATHGGLFRSTVPSTLPGPVLHLPENNSDGMPVDIQLFWSQIPYFDMFYDIEVSNTSDFSNIIFEHNALEDTVATLTGLGQNTTYYWHVKGYQDFAGEGDWSETWNFTTAIVPDIPELLLPADNSWGMPLRPAITWNSVATGDSYQLQVSTTGDFTADVLDYSGLTATAFTLDTDLENNTVYYWRVRAWSGPVFSGWSGVRFFVTVPQIPTSYNFSETITFPDYNEPSDYNPQDYRIVGIPGNSNQSVADFLPGVHTEAWQLYWDNGAAQNYFVEFNGSATFNCRPGRAFWVIVKGEWNLQGNVSSPNLNADNASVSIALHPGWNLITNPYMVNVPWPMVQNYNDISGPIHRFTGNFNTSANLEPLVGYYYFNNDDRSELNIPYPPNSAKSPDDKDAVVLNKNDIIWSAGVELISDRTVDNLMHFGVGEDADDALDRNDYRKPRAPGNMPSVYFYRPEWDEQYPVFASDIRPADARSYEWEFQVQCAETQELQLLFPDIQNIPDIHEVYLLDLNRACYRDLRANPQYSFSPAYVTSKFKIVVGDAEQIQAQLEDLMPSEFVLYQNYPNPFNPSTTISLQLPDPRQVSLTIYNILGQKIIELYGGPLDAGRHFFQWDGRLGSGEQAPSGIYIYKFSCENRAVVFRKMVLMK